MILETQRLILRQYKPEDIEDYWEYVSQKEVGPMCGWPTYTDKQKAYERLTEVECKKPYQFAIVWKETNKTIGSIELMEYKQERFCGVEVKNNTKEIGFLLNKNFWGRGIMPEALEEVVRFAFEELKIPQIVICHAEANTQSGRVQEKLGFKVIGKQDNYREWLDGKQTALIQRMMTREEYLETKLGRQYEKDRHIRN